MEERLYSIGKVAKMMGCSVATLRRWEKEGKIRSVRTPGGHRKFPKEVLDRLLGGDPSWDVGNDMNRPVSMAERRRFFRVPTEVSVHCQVQKNGKRSAKEFDGMVKNLNVAGAFIGTDSIISAPQDREVDLNFLEGAPELQLKGRIVWFSREKKSSFGFKYGVGVEFSELGEPDAEKIAEFLLEEA